MDALSALLPQASADDDVLELNSPTWSVPNDIFAFGLAIYNTRQWKSSSGDEKLLVLPQERPDFLSECEWDLVNKMCARIPERRVTICYVVHQLQQFVRAPAWSYAVDSRESLDPLPSEAHEVLPNSVDSCIVRKMSLTVARAIPFLERRCREMLETIGSMPQHVFDRLAVLRAQIQSRVNIEEATSVTNGFVYVLDLFYDRLIRQNAGTEQLSSNVVASFCASRAAGQNIVILHREIDRLLVLAEIPPTSASSPTPAPRGGIHDAQDVHDWQLRWNKDRREQLRAFQTYLENTEELKRQLSDPKSRMEAQVLLQFELHKHRSSYPNSVLEAMSQALSVLGTMGGSAEVVPCWFIPPYEVVLGKHIAQGGFVDVYYGEWLNTEVVVKILKPQAPESLSAKPASPPASSSGSSDDDAIELFRREADHWFTLNHQNVVHLYGACHVGTPFFVCEPAKSTSLKSHVKELACARPGYNYDKSGGDSAGIMQCLNQAGIGLKYLHERGLIHCDLKRNTFMVGTDAETIKLGDFGKSALAHSGHGRHPAHANVGTIPWKAPECLKGEEPTVMSDVYSFGMCILELLSGKYPWAGVPQAAVKFHVTKRKALPPRSKELTDLQWSLIQHMCCYEPSERISLDAVVDMLYTFRFEQ